MILLVDNYDSFVHNLGRYFERLGVEIAVARNDAIDVPRVRQLNPQAIVLSPGPCTPDEAGSSLSIVRELLAEFPILGVCLGHQTIAAALGGRIVRAAEPVHGRSSAIRHDGAGLFQNLPNPMQVGRYHSLIAERRTLPADLRLTAESDDGVIMAFQHARYPVVGVQFHPESILTEHGFQLLANFLTLAGISTSPPILNGELHTPAQKRPLPTRPVTF